MVSLQQQIAAIIRPEARDRGIFPRRFAAGCMAVDLMSGTLRLCWQLQSAAVHAKPESFAWPLGRGRPGLRLRHCESAIVFRDTEVCQPGVFAMPQIVRCGLIQASNVLSTEHSLSEIRDAMVKKHVA